MNLILNIKVIADFGKYQKIVEYLMGNNRSSLIFNNLIKNKILCIKIYLKRLSHL
jgi:hypothetical protein